MLKEVMDIFNPKPGQNFIDCTLGGGGYTLAIAKRILPDGKIVSLDLDELAINNLPAKISGLNLTNIIPVHENFKNLQAIVKKYFTADAKLDGLVFDLGLSSAQLQDRSRGFSFNLPDAPLGMNFGGLIGERAEHVVNNWRAQDLAKIFRDYGEERAAYKIASVLVRERQLKKITTTGRLVEIILKTKHSPPAGHKAKIHPATKVFQALRIAVNQELENLRLALPQAVNLLKAGGQLIVISYHSLEDRIVKQYFRQEAKDCLCPPARPVCQCGHKASLKILTPPLLRPTEEEVLKNPRARSARLRAAVRI